MNLVIVESPAKAKTIEGFLGKDFTVKSSYGHVRDIKKKGISIDIENDFLPDYQILPDKKEVVKELKDLSKKASVVWLATDEDREGEAISWHLFEALKLKEENTKRIVFNEITKSAILKAIENPRKINQELVNAQQARRVLDRLVGFELSPVLWRKVRPSLSAGRVQSVAVRLIAERENEIESFIPSSFFKTTAVFTNQDGQVFKAEYHKRLEDKSQATKLLESCKDQVFTVNSLEKKPSKRKPTAPFTTSTLQQEASRKLGFSVSKTMLVAQKLYESGKITYMRTDSVNLSETAIEGAKSHIINSYGENYSNPTQYKGKAKGAQEAHEAIRPVYLDKPNIEAEADFIRLYDLIFKRTIASQMAEAKLEKTTAKITSSAVDGHFTAKGEMIVFDGFLKVYQESLDIEDSQDQSGMLPKLSEGDHIGCNQISSVERFTMPPARYTEASLVKKLEEKGIGRPSTYAPTISTIQKRGYVVKESRDGKQRTYTELILENSALSSSEKTEITGATKNKLFPTDIGRVVNGFLVKNFETILDYNFTANVEKQFDDIASGALKWQKMIDGFYKPFHVKVEDTLENAEAARGQKLLGQDPKTGKNVYVKIGKYGPIVQLGETESEEKPKFASITGDSTLGNITLEQALSLLDYPKHIGSYEEEDMLAAIGRFGPYVKWKGKFFSIKEPYHIDSLTQEESIELIKAKLIEDAKKNILSFDSEDPPILVLNGKYGPYIKQGKKNYKIPKDKTPEKLTLEECKEIIATPKKPRKKKK